MKKGFLPFYLIYQEPFLVSQSFFVFTPENFEQYLFFIILTISKKKLWDC